MARNTCKCKSQTWLPLSAPLACTFDHFFDELAVCTLYYLNALYWLHFAFAIFEDLCTLQPDELGVCTLLFDVLYGLHFTTNIL